jgi:hypothetical protein
VKIAIHRSRRAPALPVRAFMELQISMPSVLTGPIGANRTSTVI